jgi:membrane protease YdiL (CAAX protease family)
MIAKARGSVHPSMQLITFIILSMGVIAVGYVIGIGIITVLYGPGILLQIGQLNFSNPHEINALWILQIVSTTIPIFAAPVIYAWFIIKDPQDYIKPSFGFPLVLMVLVFCIMFISSPLIECLSNINQKMVLPEFLSGIQKWMEKSEDAAQKLTAVLLQMKTFGDMISNVLIIGLLTAIAEEFMFRGCIQTIFTRWTKNTHAAIWITAILFSAFHMEFFGFLPRMMLGVLFGYFVAWSGSIWTSVWAHFINNGTAVVVTYLYQHKTTTINPDDQHLFNNAGYIFSLIIVLFLMYLYKDIALGRKQLREY